MTNPTPSIDQLYEMRRLADLSEKYRRNGTADWKQWGSATEHARYFEPVDSRSRRRCHCGCKRRATHRGMANGLCLIRGCELSMARWARDLAAYYRNQRKARASFIPESGGESA